MRSPSFAILTLLLVTACPAAAAFAQTDVDVTPSVWTPRTERFGAAVTMSYPFDDFGRQTDTGYGLHGIMAYPLIPLLSVSADVGWNHFPGDGDRPSVDVWEIAGGLRFDFGAFFMGGEAGYYTEVDEGSFVPSAGLAFGRFEVAVRWKAVGGGNWTALRAGYYF